MTYLGLHHMDNTPRHLPLSLLLLRLGIFIVMFVWTLDKFVNPEHSGKVFAGFYGLEGLGAAAFLVIGAAQMLVVLAFVAGFMRKLSYALILAMHTVSTVSAYQRYLDPFNHLLFFAAWPMLAAAVALYLLRDHDTLLSWDARSPA
jgi:putative oxidoreductase